MTVERIGVVGAGTMGAGIAQVACLGGFETRLHDPVGDALATAEERIHVALAKGARRELWPEADASAAAARLRIAEAEEELAGCELVIEAAPESLELKRELFVRLEAICGPDTILATNTSSLSVTALAAALERPGRVCGMHFFNPPALMRLVEVVAGEDTDETTLATAAEVARAMGREAIRAADAIGFVANRCFRPYTLEALRLYEERVSDPRQIDRIARIGGGFRMGPFELMDLIGIDVGFEVAKSFWEQSFHEPRWQPSPIQARMVAAGRLGRKAGRGYYDYDEGDYRPKDPEPPARDSLWEPDSEIEGAVHVVALPNLEDAALVEVARRPTTTDAELAAASRHLAGLGKHVEVANAYTPGLVLGRILAQIVNEAYFTVGRGIATPQDCDTAMRLGFNWPLGPFEWGHAVGLQPVVTLLDSLHRLLGQERYRVAPALREAATAP